MELPALPVDFASVIPYLNKSTSQSELFQAVQPYIDHETKLRQIFAQHPQHEVIKNNHLVPVFAEEPLTTKARDLENETDIDKEKYILALPESQRHKHGSLATVPSIKDFRTNFNVFSEQSLVDLDWSNVVAAGSSVVTPLLPIDKSNNESKRALRSYYHEKLAPASDVDLFIYGLNEEQAIKKIKQIEQNVKDSILAETTTIRTKNAITIVSEYPVRHVQIVLRLYKNVTEILTGFDVDCSCIAYDGDQVWASPRALVALATQQNRIDLTRRSPSYENRLSKYSHRGFEVHWPLINRNRVDPTIYERAFNRVVGLARLLVLEKLPHPSDRDSYADKRRREKGRPDLPWNARYRHALPGNVKDAQPDDVPDWLEDDNHSDYHTFTIPYGPKYTAKKVETLLFKQDLLLNAEWNRPKDRETKLHRHPAFFGSVDDVIQDCCGFCPDPTTDEDLKAHEEESKRYISGELQFMKDDPGRQAIGSFNPLTDDDWTDMAYLGSSVRLCQSIVDKDLQAVKDWFGEAGADVNRRDHTGRTPLQLACMCSTPEIVQELVEHGARIVSRIYNGMTALHMAAHRGSVEIVKILLDRSELNEEEEDRKEEVRKQTRRAAATKSSDDVEMSQIDDEIDDDIEMVDEENSDSGDDEMTQGSFVKVKEGDTEEENEDEPDVYDVDVLAWDNPVSPLHLAILGGHTEVICTLIDKYGADVMLPVKLKENHSIARAILSLVLPMQLPESKAKETITTLLSRGASSAQADSNQVSNIHYIVNEAKTQIVDLLDELDGDAVRKAVNHLVITGGQFWPMVDAPILTALRTGSSEMVNKVLDLGAKPSIDFESFAKAFTRQFENASDQARNIFDQHVEQPIIQAVTHYALAEVISRMLDMGVDVNTMNKEARVLVSKRQNYQQNPRTVLDLVREQIKKLSEFKVDTAVRPVKPDYHPTLENTGKGAYESWMLRTNHQQAENLHKEHMQKYEEDLKIYENRDQTSEAEKKQLIADALAKWNGLESKLLTLGAKPFTELHPDIIVNSDNRNYFYQSGRSGENRDRPYSNDISFRLVDMTNEEKKARYLQLFEAVYAGKEDIVKSLCLDPKAPLQIAVQDSAGNSPFSLSVLRGHYNLARTVLDIAANQYQPPKTEQKTYRYSIRRFDDDEDASEDSDSENMSVYGELTDENYTIDDIRTLSDNVKSQVSPATLLQWGCELWRMVNTNEQDAKKLFQPASEHHDFYTHFEDDRAPIAWFWNACGAEHRRNTFSLLRYAIVSNDETMLKFLLALQQDLLYQKTKEETLNDIKIAVDDFELALRLGRTELLSEIIRSTGTMLPLADLVEKSGVELDEKPDYYQGLTVYGQKKKEWAQQDRGQNTKVQIRQGSPFLAAIMSGNIKTVEYFLSDTPLRCYEDFAKTFQHNKKIESLAKSEGGIERALHSWLDARAHLAIHMAVMADPVVSKPVRDFVIKRMPQYLNAKSDTGISPLHLAFQMKHYEAAKELIEAGADQYTHDSMRNNLLHTIYTCRDDINNSQSLKDAVNLLKPEIVRSLAMQRCSGDGAETQTPLMKLLRTCFPGKDTGIFDAVMAVAGGEDLNIIDGAGDYPLHALLRGSTKMTDAVKYLINIRPELLFKENATGTTPLEIAETAFFRNLFDHPPQVATSSGRYHYYGSRNLSDPTKPTVRGTQVNGRDFYYEVKAKAEEHSSRRNLVPLLDANEAARRLAEQQKKKNEETKEREAKGRMSYRSRRYRYLQNNNQDEQDEVFLWFHKATTMRQPIHWERVQPLNLPAFPFNN